MAIYGDGVILSANDNGNMIVNVGGTDRLNYNFTNGTITRSGHLWAQLTSSFGADVTGAANYLDTPTINESSGTFTFTGGRFTCPRAGAYRMSASYLARTNWHHWAAKNDVMQGAGAHNTSSTAGYSTLYWSWITSCAAGDTLSFRGNQNGGRVWGGSWSTLTIEYLG
jgi:hypothetical protein